MLLRTIHDEGVLRGRCESYNHDEDFHLVGSMVDAMYANSGVGLAAPQVGVNKQLFVYDVGMGAKAYANPWYRYRRGSQISVEGCLSIPDRKFTVERSSDIALYMFDVYAGKMVSVEASGFEAVVIQHEVDHLVGKLIIDIGEPLW